MKKLRMLLCLALILCGVFMGAQKSNAISIVYEATDLTDTVPGENLWQYSYTVSDYTFNESENFIIYFDYTLYGDVEENPTSPNNGWYVTSWNSYTIGNLNEDGAYAAMALTNGSSLLDLFNVSFVWLGTGTPGAQIFELADESFTVLEKGYTISASSPVPEPSTWALLSSGFLILAGFNRLRKNKA